MQYMNGSGAYVTVAVLMVQVLQGSEPNEHGTWQYGRGGWCDGQEVIFAYCAFCTAFHTC